MVQTLSAAHAMEKPAGEHSWIIPRMGRSAIGFLSEKASRASGFRRSQVFDLEL